MSCPVVTKLAPPNVDDAVVRPRLFAWLDRGRERPVIWISAPAGAGKSTLVAGYARARALRCQWYSVDVLDNDPGTLFYYLGRGAESEQAAGTPSPPVLATDHPIKTLGFARRFFEEFFRRIQCDLLVFDDCQNVPSNDRWYSLVRQGCEVVPPGMCIVFISRVRPPAVFSRLLASSCMNLLGWEELRLSSLELRELVRVRSHRHGLELSDEELNRIDSSFGGWAAGVVLALESTRFYRSPPLDTLADASQQLFDYFAAEVFDTALPELQTFLLRSAFLPTLTAPVLEQLFKNEQAVRLLARLKADNFFIDEYGSAPPSYRYHPLFREFLLERAQIGWTGIELQRAQREAAEALAAVGDAAGAIDLFLSSSDQVAAARLIVREAPRLVSQGRAHTVCEWVEQTSPRHIESEPWLAYWAGVANLASRPGRAVEYCRLALSAFDETGEPRAHWLAWRALTQAYQVEGEDYRKLEPLVKHALQAYGRGVWSSQTQAEVLPSVVLAIAAYAPDSPDLAQLARQALLGPECRDPEELMLGLLFHGFRGELPELSEIVERWERRVERDDLGPVIRLWLCLAKVFRALFTGQFTVAQGLVREALELSEREGLFGLNSLFLTYSAYAHAALGETRALAVVADELAGLAIGGRRNDVNRDFSAGLAALLTGDLARAKRRMEKAVSISECLGSPLAEGIHRLGRVEALVQSSNLAAAREDLSRARERSDGTSHILAQCVRLADADLSFAEGDESAGDELLAEGLSIGSVRGFMPLPLPSRLVLAKLARRALERGIQKPYVDALVQQFKLELSVRPRSSGSPGPRRADAPPCVSFEFSRSVRDALRHFHEPHRLVANRLLESLLVIQSTGVSASDERRLEVLRHLLRQCLDELRRTVRTEPSHRCLYHTYFQPRPTQLLAAEGAGMSFGTYRRHLAAGREAITTALWLREQSLRREHHDD